MEEIKILYVDDNHDDGLSKYLEQDYKNENSKIISDEYKFNIDDDNYLTLLENKKIQESDIIIIDSKLFEDSKVQDEKITGEDLSIILQNSFCYKRFIVITQNDYSEQLGFCPKWNSMLEKDYKIFYEKNLKPKLDKSVEEILVMHKFLDKLKAKESIDKILIDKMKNKMSGIYEYDNLTKKDIDDIASLFNDIKDSLNGK